MASSNPVTDRNDPAYDGNEFFVQNEYAKALAAYSKAIKKYPAVAKLHANRAMTYLKLDRPFDALKDIETGLKIEPDYVKLIYRKCVALLEMRRFYEAGQYLDESIGRLENLKENKEFKTLIDDIDRLKPEYERGQYDLPALIEEAKKSNNLLENHADYFARNKYEIRKVDGKGRGLVAKNKIEAGELLIACKAFVIVRPAEVEGVQSMAPKRRRTGGELEPYGIVMAEKVIKKVIDRPDLTEQLFDLYAGSKLGHLEKWREGDTNVIDDAARIVAIINSNRFRVVPYLETGSRSDSSPKGNDSGLFLVPSFINHTCVDTNCIFYFVGDYMFVRATKSIEIGEELLIPYVSPLDSFEERQRVCKAYGFDCHCRLCVVDRRDPIEIKRRLDEISKFVSDSSERMKQGGHAASDIPTLKNLLRELLQLRPQCDLNFVALRAYDTLAGWTNTVDANEGLRLMMEYYEIQKSTGRYTEPQLQYVKALAELASLMGKEEHEKWKTAARGLAKLIYGDERMAD